MADKAKALRLTGEPTKKRTRRSSPCLKAEVSALLSMLKFDDSHVGVRGRDTTRKNQGIFGIAKDGLLGSSHTSGFVSTRTGIVRQTSRK